MNMQVARIFLCKEELHPLKAIADVAIEDKLLVKGFKIVEGKNGLFIRYPSQRGKDNQFFKSVVPLSGAAANEINETIFQAYYTQNGEPQESRAAAAQ